MAEKTAEYHKPVLLKQTIDLLRPKPGDIFLDCTIGGGGHSEAILEKILPGGKLIGIDRDQEALDYSAKRLGRFSGSLVLAKAKYSELDCVLEEAGVSKIEGALLDTGASSRQLDSPERGFSFSEDGPLDMRMDRAESRTAADLVNSLGQHELARIMRENADEKWASRIAAAIVRERSKHRIETTRELAEIIERAIPKRYWPENIHPATKAFMSLRIELNDEYGELRIGLQKAAEALNSKGRLACITFQSGEDRIAKETFGELSGKCVCPSGFPVCVCGAKALVRVITKKPIVPDENEILENPRCRSAKLRVVEKL